MWNLTCKGYSANYFSLLKKTKEENSNDNVFELLQTEEPLRTNFSCGIVGWTPLNFLLLFDILFLITSAIAPKMLSFTVERRF